MRMAGKTHVTMERDNCISCGNCWTTCPEFFEASPDDGQSQVVVKFRTGDGFAEGDAPEDLDECVRSAAEGCPADVIHVG
jgi:ferredoxin